MKKYLFLFLFPLTLLGQKIDDISGTINYYYINRISDGSIINLPFRIADIKWQREKNTFSIYSHLALEYRIPSGNHFLESTSPQDFIWDLRELYLTFQLANGEIRIGKQIHSWGSVDGNSPVGNLNAYDYYYIFESGTDQKIGALSTAADFYLGSWKFGLAVSPVHNTNRLPMNDPEFPVKLPASPSISQIIEVNNPTEFGGFIIKSFNFGEATLTYFSGYDRVFSSSGFNILLENNETFIDTVFSYRKTEVMSIGGVALLGQLTARGEIAYFNTIDENDHIERITPEIQNEVPEYSVTKPTYSAPFLTEARYTQFTVQLEYELPWEVQFAGQYFQYDTLDIISTALPNMDALTGLTPEEKDTLRDLNPADFFFPGMGAPMALLTKRALLLNVIKKMYDNRIELSLRTMMDMDNSGKLIEMGFAYDINESLKSYLAVTKIIGDDTQIDKYTFNNMEDFSHIRCELTYSF